MKTLTVGERVRVTSSIPAFWLAPTPGNKNPLLQNILVLYSRNVVHTKGLTWTNSRNQIRLKCTTSTVYASLMADISLPRTRIPPTSIRMYACFRAWEIKIFKKLRKF